MTLNVKDVIAINHFDVIGLAKLSNSVKLRKIRARSFKVTDVGTNQKPVCVY